jgi:hypothetical protein
LLNSFIINRNEHESLLADHRKDPVTKKLLQVGDEIVICAKCKIAYLKDSWVNSMNGVCENGSGRNKCDSRKTLSYISSKKKYVTSTKVIKKRSAFPIIFPWIIVIAFGVFLFSNRNLFYNYKRIATRLFYLKEQYHILEKQNNNKNIKINNLQLQIRNLENFKEQINPIENIIVNLNEEKAELSNQLIKYQNSIANYHISPILIKSIEFRSANSDHSKIYIECGELLKKSKIYYLCPRITYIGNSFGKIKLYVKIIDPNGNLERNSSSSPKGFTYDCEVNYKSGKNYKRITGWGHSTDTIYISGWYQIEIWYDDICIGYKKFYISDN